MVLRLYGTVSFQRRCVHDNTVVVWGCVRVFRYSLARAQRKGDSANKKPVISGKPEGGVGRGGWRPMQRRELEFLRFPGCRGRAARANPMISSLSIFLQVRW